MTIEALLAAAKAAWELYELIERHLREAGATAEQLAAVRGRRDAEILRREGEHGQG